MLTLSESLLLTFGSIFGCWCPSTNCVWTRLDKCLNTTRSHELDSFLYGACGPSGMCAMHACSDVVAIPIAWRTALLCFDTDHASSCTRAGAFFDDWRIVDWHHGATFLMFAICTFLTFCPSNLALRNFSTSKGEPWLNTCGMCEKQT